VPATRRFPRLSPALAAFAWSLAFGLLSLFWAAGGEIGLGTLAQAIQDSAREGDDAMRLTTAVTGVLKIAAGLVALAAPRPVGGRRLRLVMRSVLWGVGILYALYGLLGLVEKLLMALGVLRVPAGLGADAVWWYLLWWEPFWLLGGVLFLATASRFRDYV
jgi:hypothetical protein